MRVKYMRLITTRLIEELRGFWDANDYKSMKSIITKLRDSSQYRYESVARDIGEFTGEYYIHAYYSTNELLRIIKKKSC